MRLFTKKSIDEIFESFEKYRELGKEPPKEFLEDIKKSLPNAYRGVRIYFYQELPKRFPELVQYFIEDQN